MNYNTNNDVVPFWLVFPEIESLPYVCLMQQQSHAIMIRAVAF